MSNKFTGTVKWFDNAKGYSFLDGPDGDVFVHYRSVLGEDGYKTLKERQAVEYVRVKTEKGRPAAEVMVLETA